MLNIVLSCRPQSLWLKPHRIQLSPLLDPSKPTALNLNTNLIVHTKRRYLSDSTHNAHDWHAIILLLPTASHTTRVDTTTDPICFLRHVAYLCRWRRGSFSNYATFYTLAEAGQSQKQPLTLLSSGQKYLKKLIKRIYELLIYILCTRIYMYR